ncbi:MAG TPA: L,D-transpeptidase family protein [Bacteroidales bacterium]|nr:L,D-transpeptidase family protein [Bacteroidales bacterium]
MKKVNRLLLYIVVFTGSLPLAILLLIFLTPVPPTGEMEHARKTISIAGRGRADTYSNKLYAEAQIYYDSAMGNWQNENNRFIYFRNFEKVALFAELSTKKASQAAENAVSNSSNLKMKLIQKIDSLNNLISGVNKLFYTYPLTSEIRERISRGKLFLKEAEIAYQEGQYLEANIKISDSELLLMEGYSYVNENLKEYFQSYPVWKSWIDKTISDSKKNRDYSIIVDKFSRKCFIYLNGIKQYEFEADLGLNWVGDKKVRGDMATPEGMYKITKKIEGSNTRYYKSLLLNYPNDEDKMKFQNEVISGSLLPNAIIGSLIEIHGSGGIGIDWTQGCVALTNNEMDVVFKIAKVGTPVTIVGSMTDLQYVVTK